VLTKNFVGVGVNVGVEVFDGVNVGVGVKVLVDVAVGVKVFVDVAVAVSVAVGVGQRSVVIFNSHPPLIVPVSPAASSTTYSDHVPFGAVPTNVDNDEPPAGAGAGAGKVSPVR